MREKGSPKIWATFVLYKKMPNVNNGPMVTLVMARVVRRLIKTVEPLGLIR
jgi:hypothetical protein